jgi:hypothetical protein
MTTYGVTVIPLNLITLTTKVVEWYWKVETSETYRIQYRRDR